MIGIPNQNTKQLGNNAKLIQTKHKEYRAGELGNLEGKIPFKLMNQNHTNKPRTKLKLKLTKLNISQWGKKNKC